MCHKTLSHPESEKEKCRLSLTLTLIYSALAQHVKNLLLTQIVAQLATGYYGHYGSDPVRLSRRGEDKCRQWRGASLPSSLGIFIDTVLSISIRKEEDVTIKYRTFPLQSCSSCVGSVAQQSL